MRTILLFLLPTVLIAAEGRRDLPIEYQDRFDQESHEGAMLVYDMGDEIHALRARLANPDTEIVVLEEQLAAERSKVVALLAEIERLKREVTTPPGSSLRIEAESAAMTGGWVGRADLTASGGRYAECLIARIGSNHLTFGFVVTAGKYALRARVKAPTEQSNSFRVGLDGGSAAVWAMEPSSQWAEYVVNQLTLTAGPHTIAFHFREPGRIDWVELVPIP